MPNNNAQNNDNGIQYNKRKQSSVLTMNTVAFAVNFMVWTMFSIIGIKIKDELGLNETEFGLLVATPILSGSLVRLPLGILTDRFGGRIVYFIQMILVAIPTYGLAHADQYWQYLIIGLFVGLAGGSFAIGIAYTSAWFGKARRWEYSVPAMPAPPSPTSPRRLSSSGSAGAPCRKSIRW